MIYRVNLKPLFVFALLVCLSTSSVEYARASAGAATQEDPNAQYILIQSGELTRETRVIDVPVEVGVWKLQFNLQSNGEQDWTIITPSDRPLSTDMPNLTITNTREGATERRSILIWDPRPGKWQIKLSGSGKFTTSVTTQGELHVCCLQFFGRAAGYSMDRFQPARGSRHQAQIFASGYNIETIEFQMISEQGETLAPMKFRQSDYSNPQNFLLIVDTPDRPFRVLAKGRDISGKKFQRVTMWMIRPQTSDSAKGEGAKGEGQGEAPRQKAGKRV